MFLVVNNDTVYNKVTVIPIVIGVLGTVIKGTGGLANKRTSRDYANYSVVEIGQNTQKSPGDFRGLAVTLTPVKKNQLTPV